MRWLAVRFLLILLLPLFAAAQYLIAIWSDEKWFSAKLNRINQLSASYLIGCLMWMICLSPTAAVCQIISPERLFGRYQQFVWQDQHGLPQNGISEVVQTPDGYLWLAIAEGVVRFDGVRSEEHTSELQSQ